MPQEGRVQVLAEHGRLPSTVGYVADTSNFFDSVTVGGGAEPRFRLRGAVAGNDGGGANKKINLLVR